jgi:hypothetical protein
VRDLLYLGLTLAIFIALLGYVRFCAWAGGQDADAGSQERAR